MIVEQFLLIAVSGILSLLAFCLIWIFRLNAKVSEIKAKMENGLIAEIKSLRESRHEMTNKLNMIMIKLEIGEKLTCKK